jgi:hypothetical protein
MQKDSYNTQQLSAQIAWVPDAPLNPLYRALWRYGPWITVTSLSKPTTQYVSAQIA